MGFNMDHVGHLARSAVAAAASNVPPDWSTLDVALTCPRCAYNLHMLTSDRCPECGFRIDWRRLEQATREMLISPLFEFRWRRRPVRSLIGTMIRALWPWRLWRDVPIETQPRVRPLLLTAVLITAITAATTFLGGVHFPSDVVCVRTDNESYSPAAGIAR